MKFSRSEQWALGVIILEEIMRLVTGTIMFFLGQSWTQSIMVATCHSGTAGLLDNEQTTDFHRTGQLDYFEHSFLRSFSLPTAAGLFNTPAAAAGLFNKPAAAAGRFITPSSREAAPGPSLTWP